MTPEEARDLLKNTTPGPWRLHEVKGHPHLRYIASGTGHSGDPTAAVCIPVDVTSREGAANMRAKASVPSMLAMIAGMREEWGVVWPADDISPEWTAWGFRSAEDACEHIVGMSAPDKPSPDIRIVRRYVTEPEEA